MPVKELRQHMRQPQGRTNGIAMRIAKFGTLDKSDMSVRPVDISATGVCVEADVPLEPGFVWFRDNVGHHQCGVIVWTKRGNNTCRAGIKFMPLAPGREVTASASAAYPYLPSFHAPQLVACMLVDEVPVREG
jgi:PilZ domain